MFKIILTIAVIVLAYSLCWSTIINVPADYSTIQQGINAGGDGDTVIVQPGIYYEHIDFNSHDVLLGSMFIMTGDTSYISSTIIDGSNSGTVVKIWRGERGMAGVEGMTMQNGRGADGGGIYIGGATPIISRNVIQNNSSGVNGDGGGIYFAGGGGLIINNVIRNNTTNLKGGGICNRYGDCLIIGNIICDNTSNSSGGGIMNYGSDSFVSGNVIYGNYSGFKGGGICFNGTGALINNVICINTASDAGGGIRLWSDANLTIINNIIRHNTSPLGPQIRLGIGSSVSVSYSNVDGGWQGTGNIDLDPLFRDPLNADFHLMSIACGDSANSPCIDAGHPDSLDLILDCFHGLGGVRSDMGAFGGGYIWTHNCIYEVGDVNGDASYDGLDVTYGVAFFKGNFPNPVYGCFCTYSDYWFVSGDVNGSCSYNGLDITYGVSYFKGYVTEIFPCPECPPVE